MASFQEIIASANYRDGARVRKTGWPGWRYVVKRADGPHLMEHGKDKGLYQPSAVRGERWEARTWADPHCDD